MRWLLPRSVRCPRDAEQLARRSQAIPRQNARLIVITPRAHAWWPIGGSAQRSRTALRGVPNTRRLAGGVGPSGAARRTARRMPSAPDDPSLAPRTPSRRLHGTTPRASLRRVQSCPRVAGGNDLRFRRAGSCGRGLPAGSAEGKPARRPAQRPGGQASAPLRSLSDGPLPFANTEGNFWGAPTLIRAGRLPSPGRSSPADITLRPQPPHRMTERVADNHGRGYDIDCAFVSATRLQIQDACSAEADEGFRASTTQGCEFSHLRRVHCHRLAGLVSAKSRG